MRVRAMPKQPRGDVLEACRCAVAILPAQLLNEVHEFVFDDPLERFEAILAVQPADADLPVVRAERVEEHAAGDGDLEAYLAAFRGVARRRAAGLCHAWREPEGDASTGEDLLALATEEPLVA